MNRRQYIVAVLALTLGAVVMPRTGLAESDLGSPRRVLQMKTALGITSGQIAPWSDYVAALEAYRTSVRDIREIEIQLMGGAQAIDTDSDAALHDRQNARLQAKANLRASYDTLYDTLDPDQRRIADTTLTAGECGR